jgi:hypothetical protein
MKSGCGTSIVVVLRIVHESCATKCGARRISCHCFARRVADSDRYWSRRVLGKQKSVEVDIRMDDRRDHICEIKRCGIVRRIRNRLGCPVSWVIPVIRRIDFPSRAAGVDGLGKQADCPACEENGDVLQMLFLVK